MKKFYIVANPDKENTKNMQTAVEEYLTTRGAKVSAGKSASGHGNPYTDPEDVPGDTECVITLGGDGTLIQAARDLAGRDLPMIGINLGGLGYLTQIGREGDVKELLDALLEDSYQIQERMMLKGCVYRDGRPVKGRGSARSEIKAVRGRTVFKRIQRRWHDRCDTYGIDSLQSVGGRADRTAGRTAHDLDADLPAHADIENDRFRCRKPDPDRDPGDEPRQPGGGV